MGWRVVGAPLLGLESGYSFRGSPLRPPECDTNGWGPWFQWVPPWTPQSPISALQFANTSYKKNQIPIYYLSWHCPMIRFPLIFDTVPLHKNTVFQSFDCPSHHSGRFDDFFLFAYYSNCVLFFLSAKLLYGILCFFCCFFICNGHCCQTQAIKCHFFISCHPLKNPSNILWGTVYTFISFIILWSIFT